MGEPFVWLQALCLALHVWTLAALWHVYLDERDQMQRLIHVDGHGSWSLDATMWNVTKLLQERSQRELRHQDESGIFGQLNGYIDNMENLHFRCSMAMLAGAVLCLRYTLRFGQLALLVTTISNAFEALWNFLVVFMLFLFTFGTVAWVMYGSELQNFRTISPSHQISRPSCLQKY